MKAVFISIILAAVFVAAFVIRVDTRILGPDSSDEVDDLRIQEAYLSEHEDTLILITLDRWTALSLEATGVGNPQNRNRAARDGTFLHWTSFNLGRPPASQLRQMKPVAVTTGEYASFGYYHHPPDGRPRRNATEIVNVPDGYHAALFRSNPTVGRGTSFKSYLLATTSQRDNGLFGATFLYDPDSTRTIVFRSPWDFAPFAPSFLGLCIALPLAFSNLRGVATSILFVLAFLLHGLSFLIYEGLVQYGEAWSGYGTAHNNPINFFGDGCIVLAALIVCRVARAMMPQGYRGSEIATETKHDY